MGVKTYDAAKVSVIVGGIPMTGFGKGTFVKVTYDEAAFEKYVGTDGSTSRGKTNNKGAKVMITLANTSPSNDVLSGLYALDQQSNSGVVPVLVKDINGTTLHETDAGWVEKLPDDDKQRSVNEREWTLDCADMNGFLGGNVTAGAGA